MYTDILQELYSTLQLYPNRNWPIGGDFNTYLNIHDYISHAVTDFIVRNNVHRVDMLHPVGCNEDDSAGFNVIDLDVNLSDHMPILAMYVRMLLHASRHCDH